MRSPLGYGILTHMYRILCLTFLAALSFALSGCGEPVTGPYTFTNNTSFDPLYLRIEQNGKSAVHTIVKGGTVTGESHYAPQVTAVKSADSDVVNNAVTCYTQRYGYDYVFTDAESYQAVIRCIDETPAGYTLIDETGKFFMYSDNTFDTEDGQNKPVELGTPETDIPVTAYSDNPSFAAKAKDADKTIPLDFEQELTADGKTGTFIIK